MWYLRRAAVALAVVAAMASTPGRKHCLAAQDTPPYLRDRGTGVATSMFGTYIRRHELLVYPFAEWYVDDDFEYKPSELGAPGDIDYRGRYRATEGLIFLGYGMTEDFAVEMEAAVIDASLRTASEDPSSLPDRVEESGLGDVEAQLRWRFARETASRPELFTYFETVFPFQKTKRLIGTPDWELKLGVGLIKGYRWGTMTVRAAMEYSAEENKLEYGEYAFEWLRRWSPAFRTVAVIEGNQIDEIELITELQWHFSRRAFLKANTGFGLTRNATGLAPELGVMFSF